MALTIENLKVERLATQLARLTGQSKTAVIRQALEQLQRQLSPRLSQRRGESFLRFLEEEVWPKLPHGRHGRLPTPQEEDQILGYGPEGV